MKKGLLLFPLMLTGLVACGKTPETPKYTITWTAEGETLKTDLVASGTLPTYDGEEPVKEVADEDLTTIAWYDFEGWTPEVVAATADATYTAVFVPVLTHDLAETACADTITILFGEEYVDSFLKDEWETNGEIRFTVNVGSSMTVMEAANALSLALMQGMSFSEVSPMEEDEETGYVSGIYLDEMTGVVAFPLAGMVSDKVIIQIEFTHYNLIA